MTQSAHVVRAAERLGIDERGVDRVERDVHEPWLERSGLTERTRRGRIATEEARLLYGRRALA